MRAELTLNLPWVREPGEFAGDLLVRRGRRNVLSYDDGIKLKVHLLDPAAHWSAESLLRVASEEAEPGHVLLVAGAVPVEWRAALRQAGLSFLDVQGVLDINWPRLRVSVGRFAQPVRRRRVPIPLQQGHAVVVQELLISTVGNVRVAIGDLANGAGVSLSTASRAIAQLAEHGLVAKNRVGRNVLVDSVDRVGLSERLAAETAWPGGDVLGGYSWGRSVWEIASMITANAARSGIAVAVTGRAAAAFLGVVGSSSPSRVHGWIDLGGRSLVAAAEELGLEPATGDEVNVVLSTDPQGVGMHRRRDARFEEWTAAVAHPVRVWCDLHSEPRGTEFAAQLWRMVSDGGWPGEGQ